VQIAKPVQARHALSRGPVAAPVDADHQVCHAAVAMKTGADAEDGRGLADGNGCGQRPIENHVESGSVARAEVPLGGDHGAHGTGISVLAMLLAA